MMHFVCMCTSLQMLVYHPDSCVVVVVVVVLYRQSVTVTLFASLSS